MTDTTTATRSVTVPCPFCATPNRVDLARHEEMPPRRGECQRPIPTLVAFHQGGETRRHARMADLSLPKELAGLE